jgi:serine/threonine protein phosphatase PrpC
MKALKFHLAAWSDAAGRTDNEDCFLVGADIAAGQWAFRIDDELTLGERGALLVVCDGMGGMNAGEVASALAVETVREWFAPDKVAALDSASPEAVAQHISETVSAADRRIKDEAAADAQKTGMGSTIVMAWLLDGALHIGWCGDSRAYRYNPATGLERLTHDHSYVQELVDAGRLTPEQAMEHPDSNIITRSLGDSGRDAIADTTTCPLCNGDVILLCSDGLCGVLNDSEIEAIVAQNAADMRNCRDALLAASEQKGWTDNLTLVLCHVASGAATARPRPAATPVKAKPSPLRLLLGVLTLAFLLATAFIAGYYCGKGVAERDEMPCCMEGCTEEESADSSDEGKGDVGAETDSLKAEDDSLKNKQTRI